jgi:hypothetical protein
VIGSYDRGGTSYPGIQRIQADLTHPGFPLCSRTSIYSVKKIPQHEIWLSQVLLHPYDWISQILPARTPKKCPFISTVCASQCTTRTDPSIDSRSMERPSESWHVKGCHDRGEPRIQMPKGFRQARPTQVFPVLPQISPEST